MPRQSEINSLLPKPRQAGTCELEQLRIVAGLLELQKRRRLVCWVESSRIYVARRPDPTQMPERRLISWEEAAKIVEAGTAAPIPRPTVRTERVIIPRAEVRRKMLLRSRVLVSNGK